MGRLNVLKVSDVKGDQTPSADEVITAQGAKCQNVGIVELNVRIREFEKPWLFHVLADLEYPCILGVDFISGAKIILDFDRKSLAIADSQIDTVVKTIEEEKVEIDLSKTRSEYFQLAVNPSDIVKTTFVTKNGTYAFLCITFGLSGAAPNFQKSIDIILKPVIGKFVNVHMDHVIISSPSFTQHIEHLKGVFRLLHEAGLTLNKDKKAQKAFDVIKATITKVPVLKLPDFKKPFELFRDASLIGVGAVLNQEQIPVVFASRTLSTAERNYTLTERECLAVVCALNKFRTYLGSLPIKVITDHAALTHLTHGKKLSNRIIRWALKLAEFNIEWEHRSGTQNEVSDVLSRNPVESIKEEKVNCALIRDMVLSSREQLIEKQRKDPELGHIYKYLKFTQKIAQLMRQHVRIGPVVLD
ncbi:retrovirus-related Pol polyprotein from transposon gypsy [Trichonephila clavipes]|nr:retrovirus-related Pol polyprotein from transposon gypsy [Trichonephila clavipes]